MKSRKTNAHTYLICAIDIRENQLREFSVIVIINDEIFICLAMEVCPINFYGPMVLHKKIIKFACFHHDFSKALFPGQISRLASSSRF